MVRINDCAKLNVGVFVLVAEGRSKTVPGAQDARGILGPSNSQTYV
jgi:hypothetical protein